MATLRAPFNFVPLNDKPYIPSWSENISQDIPFSDTLSGSLKLTISSESPIFISDINNADNSVVQEFCHTENGIYFIPATSIKGSLRNVMEIISFGKMTQVQNHSFGIRDLGNGADGTFFRNKVNINSVQCGWLRLEDDKYLLDCCGVPWRISPERIDEEYGTGLSAFIRENNFKDDGNRTAKRKYELFGDNPLTGYFENDVEFTSNSKFRTGGRKIKRFASNGEKGTLVFTGQPGQRKKNSGKYFEFIFPDVIEEPDMTVPESIMKSFISIHADSPDYKDFRKEQLRRGKKIPVFFTKDSNGEIDAMGLSYMFKYPAFNTIFDGINESLLLDSKPDLCECIFGYAKSRNALKGRVQFTSAFLQGIPQFYTDMVIALAKPHPSYYPLYLGKGQTWNSQKVQIAGRKRYPTRNNVLSNQGNDNMTRKIRPLDKGMSFVGTINFHNLRPIELGALIKSINICCYHSLGQGKPLGYGKVKMSVDAISIHGKDKDVSCDLKTVEDSFVSEMESNFPGWSNLPQIVELKKMSEGIPSEMEELFTYMNMSTDARNNEFKIGINDYNNGSQLGTFTQIIYGTVPRAPRPVNVSADLSRKDIEKHIAEMERKEMEESELRKKRQAEEMRLNAYQQIINEVKQLIEMRKWDDAILKAEEAGNILPNGTEHAKYIADCKSQKEIEAFLHKDEELKAQKLSQSLADNLSGKTSIGNILGTTRKWMEAPDNRFGETELKTLVECLSTLPQKELKRLNSRKKDFEKILGEDFARKLFKVFNC